MFLSKLFLFLGFRTRFPSKSWSEHLAPRDNFDGFQTEIGNDWYDSTALNGSPVVLISILIRFQLNVPEIPSLRAKIIDSSDQTFCVSLSSEHQEPSSNHDLTYGFYILDDIPNSSESNHGSASASLCLIIRYSVYFDGKYWIRKKQIG